MKSISIIYGCDFKMVSPGGILNFVELTASALSISHMVTIYGIGARPDFLTPKVSWVAVQMPEEVRNPLHLYFTRNLIKYRKQLASTDAILIHRPEYALAITFLKCRKFLFLHGGTWNYYKIGYKLRGILYFLLELISVAICRNIISVDVSSMGKISKSFAKTISPIRVPIADSFIRPDTNPPKVKRLISTSRVVREKKLDLIINCAIDSGLLLTIIGDGDQLIELQKENLNHENIHFLGNMSKDSIAELYSCGGIFITLGVAEGYPTTVVEALASGLPAIGIRGNPGVSQLEKYGLTLFENICEMTNALKENVFLDTQTALTTAQRSAIIIDHNPISISKEISKIVFS